MNEPSARTGSYYGDCRDWLRIDLDRKMKTYKGGACNYAPDLVHIKILCNQYGITEKMIKKAAELKVIAPAKKYRASEKAANLYDGNEVALRILEIEKLRDKS